MKKLFLIFASILFTHTAFCQITKQSIDYQYFRDTKDYYSFELFKIISQSNASVMLLNFSSNANYDKIEKIYIKSGDRDYRLPFKHSEEIAKSDNPKLKNYAVSFNASEFMDKRTLCKAQLIFKLDNGINYTLPLNLCDITDLISKH